MQTTPAALSTRHLSLDPRAPARGRRALPRLGAAWVACLLLAACPADPRTAQRTEVAQVGAAQIGADELMAVLAQRGTARLQDPAARLGAARAILDDMVQEHLLVAAAERAGVQVSDEDVDREVRRRAEGYPPGSFQRLLVAEQLTFADYRSKVRRRLVQDAWLRSQLGQPAPIDEGDLRARFDASSGGGRRKVGEQVRARQILVRTAEEAAHVLGQLRARALGFEAAAQRFSTSPDAASGGDLGWFGRGDMPEVFDVCFNLDNGTISDVVASDYGFHIFQVVDRRPAHEESFDEARPRLERELVRERQDVAYERLLAELRAQTPVVIHDEVLQSVVARLPPQSAPVRSQGPDASAPPTPQD